MKIDELKNKILQLAIQGKLVEQNPNDTPASILLEEIIDEKERLIKEKIIKKEKLLADITEEEKVFELPDGWQWCRLNQLLSKLGAGSTPSGGSKIYESKGVKFIRSQNVRNDGLVLDDVVYISDDINEKMKGSIVEKGDILLNITGASIGRSCIVGDDFDIGNVNQHVTIIRIINKSITKYLHKLIISPFFQKIIRDTQVGVSREGLSMTKLREFLIPLPPLEEQKRIASKVEELFALVDELSDNKENMLRSISDTRNKVLQLAIQGKLVEQCVDDISATQLLEDIKAEKERLIAEKVIKKEKPLPEIIDEEKIFELPKGWEWCRLGEITQFLGGYAFKSDRYVEYSVNRVIRLGNVKNGNLILDEKQVFISDEDGKNAEVYKIKDGDVLVTMTGTKGKRDYFFTCIVEEKHIGGINLYLNQRVGCIRALNKITSKYLNYILKTDIQLDSIFSFETGTANQGNLGAEAIKKLVLPLPPLREQELIIDKVEMIMGYLDELEKNILAQEII